MPEILKSAKPASLSRWSAELHALVSDAALTDAQAKPLRSAEGERRALKLLTTSRQSRGNVYVIGNGGSAGVASHAVNDFVNVAALRATTLHDPALLTCMANDYGYENCFSRPLAILATPQDLLIAISSSGNSQNIRNAATAMRDAGGSILTLTGFKAENPLRELGDVNVWLDSLDYGLVEIGHLFVLHHWANRLAAMKASVRIHSA